MSLFATERWHNPAVRSKLPVIGGVAALLAGAGVLALIWSNGTDTSAACPPRTHAPVPAAAKKALAGYSGRIIHDVEHSTRDRTRDEWWDDPLTGRRRQIAFDRNGRLESEFVTTISGGVERSVWVLYPAHSVLITRHPFPARYQRHSSGAAGIAQINRDKVANGTATIVDRETIGGRETLHLRETIHPAPPPTDTFGVPLLPKNFRFSATPQFNIDTWVDPLTYLPVRTRVGAGGGSTITDETWLPRTPANIAKTKLVIPAGFKRVTPQHGSGFGFGVVNKHFTTCSQS
jgi:hypothetical protein